MATPHSGHWDIFGGRFVAQALWEPLAALQAQFATLLLDASFSQAFDTALAQRLGRPSPLTPLAPLKAGGATLWLKREDLGAGGSFCSTLALFKVLMAKHLGFASIVTETCTGDFGVACASFAALYGLGCRVYIRQKDAQRLPESVALMRLMGAHVELVESPLRGRRGARDAALRYWSAHHKSHFYGTSLLASPDPYPRIVAHALSWIGTEAKVQCDRAGITPEFVVAPVGSGGFAAGLFSPFLDSAATTCIGVQASGRPDPRRNASSLLTGRRGIFHGTCSMVLQDEEGQLLNPYSLAPGLSEVGVGPQHAHWARQRQALYVGVGDDAAIAAARWLLAHEGISCSLEAAHGLAYALDLARSLDPPTTIMVGLTGTGHHPAELEADEDSRQKAPKR